MIQLSFFYAEISAMEFCPPDLKGKSKRQRKTSNKDFMVAFYSRFGEIQPLDLTLETPISAEVADTSILETHIRPVHADMAQSLLSDECSLLK